MSRLAILILIFFSFLGISRGQNTPNQPRIFAILGNIPAFVDGKETSPVVTREDILANPTITVPPPATEVLGYKFRMLPHGKGAKLTEPIIVNGATLTNEIKNLLLNLKEPRATIFIDEIRMTIGGMEMRAQPIILVMQPKQ